VGAQPAAEEAPRARLSVTAEGCAATPVMIAERVRRRSARIEFGDFAPGVAAQLQIAIRPAANARSNAELSVQWPDGRRAERRLEAPSCGEALDALALLIALMLDPTAPPAAQGHAERVRPEAPAAQPEPAPEPSETAPATPEAPTAPAPTEAEPAQATGTSAAANTADERRAVGALGRGQGRAAPAPFAFEVAAFGASAELISGPTPQLMPGIGLWGFVALRGTGLFAPALRLRATRVWQAGRAEPGGVAEFRLDTLHLDLCPLGLRWAQLAARGCLAGGFGSLHASGADSYLPRSQEEPWAQLGGALDLTADFLPYVQFGARLGAAGALVRYRFAFRPEVFYRVAPLVLEANFGVGVRFP
jgi:hypothetical protein